ncbi:MAG: tRNA 2-thiocytidine(32) synthetase TtcA [Cystobacterineae bacterium]|nr:tRNA 2-thiocytidine(32) synthetase TtcA [Cystobacterineae bacterium]
MTEVEQLEKLLLSHIGKAVADFKLISEGDRILVGVSGGKDSYTLLYFLRKLQQRSPVKFDFLALKLDQGQPGHSAESLKEYLQAEKYEYCIVRENTFEIVQQKLKKEQNKCFLCARLRRGILYRTAVEMGFNKIALGHHLDDLIETFLMNLFFAGTTATMPPLLHSRDGSNRVIRPLCYVPEALIVEFAKQKKFPVVSCGDCGEQNNHRRKWAKSLVETLSKDIPHLRQSLLAAMGNIKPAHLLDRRHLERNKPPGAGGMFED